MIGFIKVDIPGKKLLFLCGTIMAITHHHFKKVKKCNLLTHTIYCSVYCAVEPRPQTFEYMASQFATRKVVNADLKKLVQNCD